MLNRNEEDISKYLSKKTNREEIGEDERRSIQVYKTLIGLAIAIVISPNLEHCLSKASLGQCSKVHVAWMGHPLPRHTKIGWLPHASLHIITNQFCSVQGRYFVSISSFSSLCLFFSFSCSISKLPSSGSWENNPDKTSEKLI